MSLTKKDHWMLDRMGISSAERALVESYWEDTPSTMQGFVARITRRTFPLALTAVFLAAHFFPAAMAPWVNIALFLTWMLIIVAVLTSIGMVLFIHAWSTKGTPEQQKQLFERKVMSTLVKGSWWKRYIKRAQWVLLVITLASLAHFFTAIALTIVTLFCIFMVKVAEEMLREHLKKHAAEHEQAMRTITI